MTFFESYRKLRVINNNRIVSQVKGITIGRKRNTLYGALAIFVILDDWRFLYMNDFDSFIELFMNYLTNLIGIIYVICNIYFMSRSNFNSIIGQCLT
jgi:hypothetical protein